MVDVSDCTGHSRKSGLARTSRTTSDSRKDAWPRVKLGEVCEILDSERVPITKKDRVAGPVPYYGASGIVDYVEGFLFDERLVLLGEDGAKWGAGEKSAFVIEGRTWVNNHAHVLRTSKLLFDEYLVYYLNNADLNEYITGVTVPKLNQQRMCAIELPLPPLAVQREILARLEKNLAMVERMAKGFEALKAEADQLFKSTLKETFEEVSCGGTETRRLGDVCEIQRGGSPRPIKNFITDDQNGLNWIKIGDVSPDGKYITKTADKIKQSGLSKTRQVFEGDFLLSNSMSFGRPYILRINGCIHDGWLVLRGFKKVFLEEYFYYLLRSDFVQDQFNKLAHGSTVRNLNTDAVAMVEVCEIPFPTQRKIVAKLDAVRERCEKLKRAAEEGLQTAALMRKAILKEAFA